MMALNVFAASIASLEIIHYVEIGLAKFEKLKKNLEAVNKIKYLFEGWISCVEKENKQADEYLP